MDPTLQDVLARLDRVSGQVEELRDGVRQAVAIAELDPDMALTRARKVLEFIIRDVFRRHTGEEPGTRPLENLLQQLPGQGRIFPCAASRLTPTRARESGQRRDPRLRRRRHDGGRGPIVNAPDRYP